MKLFLSIKASLLEMREKTKKNQSAEKEFKITAKFLFMWQVPQNVDYEKEAGRSLKSCFENPSVQVTLCAFNLPLIPDELGNYCIWWSTEDVMGCVWIDNRNSLLQVKKADFLLYLLWFFPPNLLISCVTAG